MADARSSTTHTAGSMFKSSFFLGILAMPKPQREAVAAVYRFCRAADDAVDLDPTAGEAGLALWREEVALCFAGKPRHEIMRGLHPHVRSFGLERECFEMVLEGGAMDLARRRYETMGELEEYCDRVAGAVGRLCLRVFGLHEVAAAQEYSRNLSYGLQLTNIIRDVGEDAAKDRVYIPQEDLGAFGYTEKELKNSVITMSYFNVMRYMVGRAKAHFGRAERAVGSDLRRRLLGPEIMRETYQALLVRVSGALDLALEGRPRRLNWMEKVSIAAGTWIQVKLL